MTTHHLKIWSEFYDDVATGKRQFELRENDRAYLVGDILKLEEFRHGVGEYTGRKVFAEVTYVQGYTHKTRMIGMPEGYCILGIKLVLGP